MATDIQLNTEYIVNISFNQGLWTYNHGTGEKTLNNSNYIPLNITKFDVNGYITDFMILPL